MSTSPPTRGPDIETPHRPTEIRPGEVEWTAVRSEGPGGQNVNKVASAVHLRFDVHRSSLPEAVKARLLARADHRIGAGGVIVIKAQSMRSQRLNLAEALRRLQALVDAAADVPPPRRATRPTRASGLRRLEGKKLRGELKAGRGRVGD